MRTSDAVLTSLAEMDGKLRGAIDSLSLLGPQMTKDLRETSEKIFTVMEFLKQTGVRINEISLGVQQLQMALEGMVLLCS